MHINILCLIKTEFLSDFINFLGAKLAGILVFIIIQPENIIRNMAKFLSRSLFHTWNAKFICYDDKKKVLFQGLLQFTFNIRLIKLENYKCA